MPQKTYIWKACCESEGTSIRKCTLNEFWQFFLLKISFFSKNNGLIVKMYRTLKIYLCIPYNFCEDYFFPRSIFIDIKWNNLLKTFFLVLTLKIKFTDILIIIFVISASKNVNTESLLRIGRYIYLEMHP